ncbi:MAG: alanine racemase [Campylobacterales bacterium]|nr:alanine racemase [Campylobacterales bacterium]
MAKITLNKNNFFNNLDIIAKATQSVDKIAVVLKDNAYGHGLVAMATMAKEYGVKKAVVQTEDEAKQIEDFFDYILALNAIPHVPERSGKHPLGVKSDKVRYTINDLHSIVKFPQGTKVELKVDTGMHRNGVAMNQLEEAFAKIKEQGLVLEALFTHHRSADELSSEWFWQKDNFKKVKEEAVGLAGKYDFGALRFHSSNSAALFRNSSFDEDMARVGIAAYGCMQLPDAIKIEGLKPVLSLYANKISSRELNSSERVGYGGTFETDKNCVVSNYDFGYGDGFLRVCSNNYTTPHAKKLVGRISMDNSSFICEDDEILIFDDASKIALSAKTMSYEVLTSLKSSIRREII